jgi:periplasmic divalent cation tolerance protein
VTDKIVILATAGSFRQARKIARRLVEQRLAACVNISSPVRSLYWWEGKIADDREYLLLIKTTRKLFAGVKDAVLETHSYTTPEIISLPVIEGSLGYLRWIDDCVRKQRKKKSGRA